MSNKTIKKYCNNRSNQNSFKDMQRKCLLLAVGFFAVLTLLAITESISWVLVAWYAVINLVTFAIYAKDKSAAQNGQWRTSEKSLHLLALAGGWVGAMLAQTYLRHKSKKTDFRMMYYLTVLINLLGLIAVMMGYNPVELLGRVLSVYL